jgi:hypothetical protein
MDIYSWDSRMLRSLILEGSKNNQWKRTAPNGKEVLPVALKCLHNSRDTMVEFLREVRYFFL